MHRWIDPLLEHASHSGLRNIKNLGCFPSKFVGEFGGAEMQFFLSSFPWCETHKYKDPSFLPRDRTLEVKST